MKEEKEKWLVHYSCEGRYEVSSTGIVRNVNTGRVMSFQVSKATPCKHFCTRYGGRHGELVFLRYHRMVAECFIPNPYNKPFVNHIDGNKLNNDVTNLEWCTPKENSIHAKELGLLDSNVRYGHDNTSSKLSPDDIIFIRENFIPRDKTYGYRALGRMFDISHSCVMNVVSFKSYK